MIPPVLLPLLPFLPLLVAWVLGWKGWALWIAARNKHKLWFTALLVVNTLGILEIIYIFAVGKPALKKDGMSSPSSN